MDCEKKVREICENKYTKINIVASHFTWSHKSRSRMSVPQTWKTPKLCTFLMFSEMFTKFILDRYTAQKLPSWVLPLKRSFFEYCWLCPWKRTWNYILSLILESSNLMSSKISLRRARELSFAWRRYSKPLTLKHKLSSIGEKNNISPNRAFSWSSFFPMFPMDSIVISFSFVHHSFDQALIKWLVLHSFIIFDKPIHWPVFVTLHWKNMWLSWDLASKFGVLWRVLCLLSL